MPDLVSLAVHVVRTSVMPRRADRRACSGRSTLSSGACTVELRLDDVAFIPAAAPPGPAGQRRRHVAPSEPRRRRAVPGVVDRTLRLRKRPESDRSDH
jgi:hypothetical protein